MRRAISSSPAGRVPFALGVGTGVLGTALTLALAWSTVGPPAAAREAQAQAEPGGPATAGIGDGGGAAPPAGDPAPTGYTLRDLYDFIASGGEALPAPGGHGILPAGGPGEGGMPAVEEVLELLQTRLPCPAGGGGLPDTGQSTCYDHLGNVTDCATGACPGQDGFYETGCPPEGRFTNNGDGTVTDTCTGLIWQQETPGDRYSWCQALAYCEGLTLAGHSDWRLPNVRELQSIVDYGRSVPSSDPIFGAESSWCWSSSSYAFNLDYAWVVNFNVGHISFGGRSDVGRVRAVRPGP